MATVSIIVPCYNQVEYLGDALESVHAQTFDDWECIIVNDGSTDETDSVSRLYLERDNRFKYVYKKNGGLSSARNAGIKVCTGEYILPLDADDKIGKNYVGLAVGILRSNPAIKVVYANAEKFGVFNGPWTLSPYSYQDMLLCNNLYCSSVYRKTDFDKTAGYDENLKSGYEDWDFWLQLLTEKDLVYRIEEVNFYYRQKGYSTVYSNDEDTTRTRNYIFKKHIDQYLRYFPDPSGIFLENKMLKRIYKNSVDYKIGNLLLKPVRSLVKFLRIKPE